MNGTTSAATTEVDTRVREDDIVATFVSMSGGLAQEADASELLTQLTVDCARLEVSPVGLLLADTCGELL